MPSVQLNFLGVAIYNTTKNRWEQLRKVLNNVNSVQLWLFLIFWIMLHVQIILQHFYKIIFISNIILIFFVYLCTHKLVFFKW